MNARERARRRFARWLRAQRLSGLTQAAIGARVRRSQSWVTKAATRGPRLDDLDLLADLMATTAGALVTPAVTVSTDAALPATEEDEQMAEDARHRMAKWIMGLTPEEGAALESDFRQWLAGRARGLQRERRPRAEGD